MVEEAELSSISRQVLLRVDTRLRVAQDTQDPDLYQMPILTKLRNDQPLLFDYVTSRSKAVVKYRSPEVMNGYTIGTALGYDIMTGHISSLERTVDITPWHMSVHDPIWAIAAFEVAAQGDPAIGDQVLDRQWFAMTWADYNFDKKGNLGFRRPNFEQQEFVNQVNEAPTLLDYLRHLDSFFQANPVVGRQAIFTGILDQVMIYRHGLEDVDSPDQRYEVGTGGTKEMPSSPVDMVFLRQQALKLFNRQL